MAGIKDIARWLLSKVLPSLVRNKVSVEAVATSMEAALPEVTRAEVVAQYRSNESILAKSGTFSVIDPARVIPVESMVESTMLKSRRYMVKYKMEVFYEKTGTIDYEYRNLYMNRNYSLNTLIQKGETIFLPNVEKYGKRVLSFDVHAVYHNQGYSY